MDFDNLLEKDATLTQEFVKRSLAEFLTRSEIYQNCPVADCPGIVPKWREDLENGQNLMVFCTTCNSNICTKCHTKWHTGKLCDGTDTDEDLKVGDYFKIEYFMNVFSILEMDGRKPGESKALPEREMPRADREAGRLQSYDLHQVQHSHVLVMYENIP